MVFIRLFKSENPQLSTVFQLLRNLSIVSQKLPVPPPLFLCFPHWIAVILMTYRVTTEDQEGVVRSAKMNFADLDAWLVLFLYFLWPQAQLLPSRAYARFAAL